MLPSIPASDRPKRSFLDVWQHNIYLTTADAQDMAALRALLEQIPVDRVLYASNYPLEERGKELMEELRLSEFLTRAEWEVRSFTYVKRFVRCVLMMLVESCLGKCGDAV
jgi:hypothetical protein